MRILVTGAGGFVGRHVMAELRGAGHTPVAMDMAPLPGEEALVADLSDPAALRRRVAEAQPDACLHLAGISFVPKGWTEPHLVFSVNLGGTVNLLEALRAEAPRARILVVTSAEVYGREPTPAPLTEEAPLAPSNLYAVSKVAADLATLLYYPRYRMHVMTARPQNHIGPGQSTQFVTGAFAEQLARLRTGGEDPVIRVGNLDCRRDFTDVRDVARAYRLLLEAGQPHRAYNIASGQPVRIGAVLEELCRIADIAPRIEVNPERYRPTDDPPVLDTTRIREVVGWVPTTSLHTSLTDIYHDVAGRTARPA